VLAYDGPSGKVKSEPVQHVFINHDTNLLDVTLAAVPAAQQGNHASTKQQGAALASHGSQAPPPEVLHTTTEHPFLTAELGWVNAQDLQPGEHVRCKVPSRGATHPAKCRNRDGCWFHG
jgi:hypothetical protein